MKTTNQTEQPVDKQVNSKPKRNWRVIITLGALVLFILAFTRGYYQAPFLFLYKYIFLFLIAGGLFFVLTKILASAQRLVVKVILSLFILAFIGSWFTPWVQNRYHELHMMYLLATMDKVEIKELPLTTENKERIHPQNNIMSMGYEKIEESIDVTNPHFVKDIVDTTQNYWSFAAQPARKNEWQRYVKNVKEVYIVPAGTANPDLVDNRYDVDFSMGESMLLDKDIINVSKKTLGLRYFYMEPSGVYYLHKSKDEIVQIVGLIKWTGFFFPIPKFGGVIEIRSGSTTLAEIKRTIFGEGKYISPKEIKNIPYLRGQNLFSEKAARMYAEAFTYLNGYIDAKIFADKALEIPDLTADQNQQPFVTDFNWSKTKVGAKNGLYHYFSLEPMGKTRKGLVLSVMMASDGVGPVYYYDHAKHREALSGVTAMPQKVQSYNGDGQNNKMIDWEKNAPVEFRPYIPDIVELEGVKKFFWLCTVVTIPKDSTTHHDASTRPDLFAVNARDPGLIVKLDAMHPGIWKDQIRKTLDLPVVPAIDSISNITVETSLLTDSIEVKKDSVLTKKDSIPQAKPKTPKKNK